MFGIIKVSRGSLKYSTMVVEIGVGIFVSLASSYSLSSGGWKTKKKYTLCVHLKGRENGGIVMARHEELRTGTSVLTLTCSC